MRQCSRELAPLAQLAGCLAVWNSSAPANPLLCESYSALSSVLTFTPANFNAVAADSFRAKIAGSLSDLMRTSEATACHIDLEFSNCILVCTLCWHNGWGSRCLVQQVITFIQET